MLFANRSIATLVIVALVVLTTLALGGFGLLRYSSERADLYRQLKQRQVTEVRRLAAALALPLWNFDRAEIDKILESTMEDRAVAGAVVDTTERTYARSRNDRGQVLTTPPGAGRDLLSMTRQIDFGGQRIGSVTLSITPRFARAKLQRTVLVMVMAIVGCDLLLVASLYLILWLAVLKPLKSIERYALAVSIGQDATDIIQRKHFLGELESLRGSLRWMVGLLELRYAEAVESEQKFRTLVENSPDLVMRYDRNGRRTYVNPAFERATGMTSDQALGNTPVDQWRGTPPAEDYLAALRRVVETGRPAEMTVAWSGPEGRTTLHALRLVPECNPRGETEGVLVIGRDVTALHESERQLRTLLDNFPDLVARFDERGRLTYLNPAGARTFGQRPEQLLDRTLAELARAGGPEPAALQDKILEVFAQGLPNRAEVHWETPAGGRIFEIRHIPEPAQSGRVASVLGIARDVTEQRRAEEALHRLNEELESRVAQRTTELARKNSELERMNRLFVGRELRMIELKRRLSALAKSDESTPSNKN